MQESPHVADEPPPGPVVVMATPIPRAAPGTVAAQVRIWPVFVALVAALALQIAVGLVIGIAFGIRAVASGKQFDDAAFDRFVKSPLGFILVGAVAQAVFLAITLVAVRETRAAARAQLGLVRPQLPWWGYPSIALGSLLVAVLGNLAATPVEERYGLSVDFEALRAQLGWGTGIFFISFLGVVPGLVEELFFRGYVQRRLLQRWSPWLAIVVTSLAFAAMHMDLAWMVFVLPIGIWLGVVAWRTGSIWPAVVGHITINSILSLHSLTLGSGGVSDGWAAASLLLFLATSGFGFIVSLVVLARLRPPTARTLLLDVPAVASENRGAPDFRSFDPGV